MANNIKILKNVDGFDYFEIDNADIGKRGWRNFAGNPTQVKPNNTDRSFNIFLSDEEANLLRAEGYNVKTRVSENNTSEPALNYLEIFIKYDRRFPRFLPKVLQTRPNGAPILIPEDLLYQLDTYEIVRAKLKVRAYDWEYNRKHGRKAMLSKLYVTIYQDDFDKEFYPDDEEIPFA